MIKISHFFFLSGVLGVFSACTPTIDNRGFEDDQIDFRAIQPGVHTQAQVLEKLGSPSTTSTFQRNTWYYVSKTTSTTSFFAPKVVSQRVVAISFSPTGVVESIAEGSQEDFKNITPNQNKTQTVTRESGVFKEVFGNFGRFSSKTPKKS